MRSLIILSAVVAVVVAKPGHLVTPLTYAAPAVHAYHAAPAVASSQYHAQDELGQYSYGYAGGPSAKHEVKTFDGVTRGGYSYVDANGIVQTVNYVADPVNGFRVAATNLPVAPEAPVAAPIPVVANLASPLPVQDTPEVAAAKIAHLAAVNEAKARASIPVAVASPVAVSTHPVHTYAAPAVHAYAAPSVASSQYHAQDELGQYSYGYAGGPSAKHEVKTFDGVTRGGYSYIDSNGIVQTVNYIADPVNGFRVAATNLPVAPAAAVAHTVPQSVYLQDAPDVAVAKAAHFAAHAEARARL